MQTCKALKPSLKPLSRSGSGKEPTGPTGPPPAEQAGATASVTLNTAYAKASTPNRQHEQGVVVGTYYWQQPERTRRHTSASLRPTSLSLYHSVRSMEEGRGLVGRGLVKLCDLMQHRSKAF